MKTNSVSSESRSWHQLAYLIFFGILGAFGARALGSEFFAPMSWWLVTTIGAMSGCVLFLGLRLTQWLFASFKKALEKTSPVVRVVLLTVIVWLGMGLLYWLSTLYLATEPIWTIVMLLAPVIAVLAPIFFIADERRRQRFEREEAEKRKEE